MINGITELLDLNDEDSTVTDFYVEGNSKFITTEKNMHIFYIHI